MAMISPDDIAPFEGAVLREVHPRPFKFDDIDPEGIVVDYDRHSDSLAIQLYGRGVDTVSVPFPGGIYVMATLDSDESVGLHIESFLARMVKANRSAIELLSYAELRGITPAEVWALQRDIFEDSDRSSTSTQRAFGKRLAKLRKQAIASFLEAELPTLRQPVASAAQ